MPDQYVIAQGMKPGRARSIALAELLRPSEALSVPIVAWRMPGARDGLAPTVRVGRRGDPRVVRIQYIAPSPRTARVDRGVRRRLAERGTRAAVDRCRPRDDVIGETVRDRHSPAVRFGEPTTTGDINDGPYAGSEVGRS